MSKVIEYTRDIFGDEDEYRCCYRGNLGNKYSFLVLSNKRLLFLHERGISSEFDKIVDVPYDKVADCSCVDRNLISINDADGNTHSFRASTSAMLVEKQLKDLNI